MQHTISTEPLMQIITSISLQKRTGLLKIESLEEKHRACGEIYFEGGNPVHAQSGKETGQEAFRLISSWKYITCAFDGMSKSCYGNHSQERETEKAPLARLLPTTTRQTRDLSRMPQASMPGLRTTETSALLPATLAPVTPSQPSRPVAPNASANARTPISSTQPDAQYSTANGNPALTARPGTQTSKTSTLANASTPLSTGRRPITQPIEAARARMALSLLPTTLLPADAGNEKPQEPPVQTAQANPRWTTPLNQQQQPQAMQQKPPATPRLGLEAEPGEDFLPGRYGVFKARSMTMTMRGIQQMERRERIIYVLLDGYRTVQDIARLTHRSEAEVEQTLLQLTHRGFTEYTGRQQSAPTTHEKMAILFRNELGQAEFRNAAPPSNEQKS